MKEIKLLDDVLISQIAAGEVVERPSNAVKELVENSLDAKAENIVIEVEDGGKDLIKVTDDGKGIFEEDLELAISRHATSKIDKEDDLWKINSLGFRGEAISSIASVSQLSIKSKRKGFDIGYEINVDGGTLMNKKEVAMNEGSCVSVRNIFYNTPARRKFLRSTSTEISNISSVLYPIALSRPQVSFKLIHNNRVIFDLAKTNDLKSRIVDIYGKNISESLIQVFYDGSNFKIDGYIGKPTISRSDTKHQFFFVNGRYVKNSVLSAVIKQAYHSMLMEHKSPVFFINIITNPESIDVNVHPKKIEIRFLNQKEVTGIVYKTIKHSLESSNLRSQAFVDDMNSDQFKSSNSLPSKLGSLDLSEKFNSSSNKSTNFSMKFGGDRFPKNKENAMDFSKTFLENISSVDESGGEKNDEIEDNSMTVLTQLNNSYIIAEDNSDLVLIDQHACHERIRYEELMDQYEKMDKDVQSLLIPQQIEFRYDEKLLVEENLEIFSSLGFDLQPFGDNTFNVYGVPNFLVGEDLEEIIKGVLDDIVNNKESLTFQGKLESIITYMACRSAIKFGQKLSKEEMQSLINQTKLLKRPYTCPHGRPTMISLTMSSLEKMFGRK